MAQAKQETRQANLRKAGSGRGIVGRSAAWRWYIAALAAGGTCEHRSSPYNQESGRKSREGVQCVRAVGIVYEIETYICYATHIKARIQAAGNKVW